MNKQLEKLRAENAKDREHADKLLARIRERDEKIRELENTEIVGIVREIGLTPEQLAERLADLHPAKKPQKKEDNNTNEAV